MHLHHLGGAVAAVDAQATAVRPSARRLRRQRYRRWPDKASSDRHIGWARRVFAAATAYGNGAAYVNFLGDEGPVRIATAYGAANFARLQRLKQRYDPANIFRYNQNIPVGNVLPAWMA